MSNLVVFIEDRIRDKCVRQTVSVNDRVDAVIESYVDKYGLPRRYFDLSHIEYRLVRAVDGRPLSGQATLREANIAQGELLQLVSREGRLVWRAVQSLFDEIESQIEGQITGKIKDRLVDEAWDRISHRLADIKKTQTEGRRVDELSERVEQVRSTAKPSAVSPVHGVVKAVVAKIGSTALSISVGAAVSLAGAVFVYALTSPPATDTPPERKITIAPATQPPTPPPAVQDTDGDGLNDGHEVEIGTDPNNPDTDQDGLRDGDEVQGCTNPLVPDTDADGLRDGDEMSQGTDPCNSNDPPRDDDRDGLTNDEEYQVGTDPLDPDSDDDGLSDYHEVTGCTNPLEPDTDGDGLRDGDEVNEGTDPCNPNPQMPDLIVEIISIDKDTIVWREEPWTWIHYRVSNIGETIADGAVYLRGRTNGAPTSGYMQVEGPIAPGGSVENRFAVGHDDLWPPGDYAVQIEVDYRLLIDEANEDNNFSSTIGFNVVAPSPGLQDFIGSWYNVDPNTRGTTRIDIWQERGVMFVHGYGSCSPTDCDWGTVAAHAEGSSLIAEYEFSFKVSHLTMTLENGLLRVYSTHRFTDGTDRDYDMDEYFSKQTKFPLKLLY